MGNVFHIYKDAFDNMPQAVFMCNNDFRITYWNKAAEQMLGYSHDEMMGADWRDFRVLHYDPEGNKMNTRETCPVHRAREGVSLIEGDALIRGKTGNMVAVYLQAAPIRDKDGAIQGVVEILIENAVRVETIQKMMQLKRLALVDTLTGIANRSYTEVKLRYRLTKLKQSVSDGGFAVLFMDVDKFKSINDIYGHDAGDIVLKTVAKCIENNIRGGDFIGRWGGEEFLVLLSSIKLQELPAVAEKIRKVTESMVIRIPDRQLRATVSIGATMAKKEDPFESLVARADTLMYGSKSDGRNCVTVG